MKIDAEKLLREILAFNSSDKTSMPEKADLYLAGISHFAIEAMEATNATSFESEKEMELKSNGKNYKCKFSIEEVTP